MTYLYLYIPGMAHEVQLSESADRIPNMGTGSKLTRYGSTSPPATCWKRHRPVTALKRMRNGTAVPCGIPGGKCGDRNGKKVELRGWTYVLHVGCGGKELNGMRKLLFILMVLPFTLNVRAEDPPSMLEKAVSNIKRWKAGIRGKMPYIGFGHRLLPMRS